MIDNANIPIKIKPGNDETIKSGLSIKGYINKMQMHNRMQFKVLINLLFKIENSLYVNKLDINLVFIILNITITKI